VTGKRRRNARNRSRNDSKKKEEYQKEERGMSEIRRKNDIY
jgi:hypothetical protein